MPPRDGWNGNDIVVLVFAVVVLTLVILYECRVIP